MSHRPDPADLYRSWMDQWRTFFTAPPSTGSPPAWTLLDRFFAAQSTVQDLVEASMRAWTDLLPRVQAGQDWASAAAEHSRRFREQFLGATRTEEDPEQQWRRYLEDLERLSAPFAAALERLPGAWRDAAPFAGIADLFWETVGATAAPLIRTPGIGPGRDFADKVGRAFEAWLELGRATTEYQAILADTWTTAFERYLRELAARTERDETPAGQRDLATLFLEVAEAVFTQTFLTDEFVRAQAAAGNATMSYLVREREVVDALFKVGHFPTRTEVDEAHRQIHELRRELRALREEIRRLRSGEDAEVAPTGGEAS